MTKKKQKYSIENTGTMKFLSKNGIYTIGKNKEKPIAKEKYQFIVPWQQY